VHKSIQAHIYRNLSMNLQFFMFIYLSLINSLSAYVNKWMKKKNGASTTHVILQLINYIWEQWCLVMAWKYHFLSAKTWTDPSNLIIIAFSQLHYIESETHLSHHPTCLDNMMDFGTRVSHKLFMRTQLSLTLSIFPHVWNSSRSPPHMKPRRE